MNTQSHAAPQFKAPAIATALATHPFYWSVRRELWENRYLYIAPLAVAGVVVFSFLIGPLRPRPMYPTGAPDPANQPTALAPYDFAAFLIMASFVVVGIFYCLDALHGERRDRSILFWKSLPVSDLTTVLSKACIPIVVLQLLTFVTVVATQLIILLLHTMAMLGNGPGGASYGAQASLFPMWTMLFYHLLAVHALWYAPIYSWLLLVSAWAKRVPILWATLPLFAISIIEKIVFNTSHFTALLKYRMSGPEASGLAMHHGDAMSAMATPDLATFLSTPGLWTGLALAALFLAAAVRLRRYREPI
jgi:ABC-2 type transport system permease protein